MSEIKRWAISTSFYIPPSEILHLIIDLGSQIPGLTNFTKTQREVECTGTKEAISLLRDSLQKTVDSPKNCVSRFDCIEVGNGNVWVWSVKSKNKYLSNLGS
jgi:hypothetical protein